MEIKFSNISCELFKNFNFNFSSSCITSIISRNENEIKIIFDLIYGLKKLEDGEIKLGRTVIKKDILLNKIYSLRKNISYLSNEFGLFNINVKEDLKIISEKNSSKQLEDFLKKFNLEDNILNKNYCDLSKSEKQKILMIGLLLKDSKYILLINPTNNLDYKSSQSLVKILKSLKREGKTIILSSNDSDFLLQVSDNVLLIENGKVLTSGNKYEILGSKLLDRFELNLPEILNFENVVENIKNRRLNYRDNILDLIKDIYRDVK